MGGIAGALGVADSVGALVEVLVGGGASAVAGEVAVLDVLGVTVPISSRAELITF